MNVNEVERPETWDGGDDLIEEEDDMSAVEETAQFNIRIQFCLLSPFVNAPVLLPL